jgi:hypothetical protein
LLAVAAGGAGTPQWQSAVAASRGFQTQSAVCADAPLENLVRWTLMEEMDKTCGWSVPSNLACNRLLSPPQLCAADTVLTQPSGNITDGVQPGGFYSSSSSCTWTINLPDMPYITLSFSKFDTEAMYDVVTVEVRGSCAALPASTALVAAALMIGQLLICSALQAAASHMKTAHSNCKHTGLAACQQSQYV